MNPSDMAMMPISLGFFVMGFSLLDVSLYADTFLCISHNIQVFLYLLCIDNQSYHVIILLVHQTSYNHTIYYLQEG